MHASLAELIFRALSTADRDPSADATAAEAIVESLTGAERPISETVGRLAQVLKTRLRLGDDFAIKAHILTAEKLRRLPGPPPY